MKCYSFLLFVLFRNTHSAKNDLVAEVINVQKIIEQQKQSCLWAVSKVEGSSRGHATDTLLVVLMLDIRQVFDCHLRPLLQSSRG